MSEPVPVDATIVGDFLDVLRVERGLSGATIAAYRRDLRQYLEHLAGAPADADRVSGFVRSLSARGLATATIAASTPLLRYP